MIQGFKQTAPLNEYERGTLLPLIIRGLRTKIGAASVISGSEIVRKMRECGYKLDGPRLRKIINHIRTSDIIPGLVSNAQGYFVATTATEIDECISTLEALADSIQEVIEALRGQMYNKFGFRL